MICKFMKEQRIYVNDIKKTNKQTCVHQYFFDLEFIDKLHFH